MLRKLIIEHCAMCPYNRIRLDDKLFCGHDKFVERMKYMFHNGFDIPDWCPLERV